MPQLRSTAFDGQFRIVTLDEIIEFLVQQARRSGRGTGLAPEIKHGSYFRSIGLPLEEKLVAILKANGYDAPDAPCFIQSFEYGNLQALLQLRGKVGGGGA